MWNKIKKHPLIKDRIFLTINSVNLTLLLSFIIFALIKISPRDFAIPGRYTFEEGLIEFGPWYTAHSYTLFAVTVFVLNLVAAQMALKKSKLSSFLILIGTGLVLILNFIIFNSYTSNVGF